MRIDVVGPGCPNCQTLEQNARDAAQELGLEAEFDKITDMSKLADLGILMTPGLMVDGEVKSSGKVLSKSQIVEILKSNNTQ